MFGINPIEMVIILVVAIIVVGPDKLPEAARTIGKAIRGLRKETDQLRETIEDDTDFGDAVRELRGALRGDYFDLDAPKNKKPAPKLDQQSAASEPAPDNEAADGDVEAADGEVNAADEVNAAAEPQGAEPGDKEVDVASPEPVEADPDLPEIKPAGHAPRNPNPAHG